MTVLDDAINRILDREGGIADVGDGKGVTRFGQTPAWLAQFQLPAPLTREGAAVNYLRWMIVTGIKVFAIDGPPPVDDLADILFDIAVMSDHHKAIKALQAILHLPIDGVLGPATLAGLATVDRKQAARDVLAWDMRYQGRLVTMQPSRAEYAAGWADRLAAHVQRLV